MKTTLWKNKLVIGMGVVAAVSAPIAIVVACGGTTESTPTPTVDAAEAAAQKSIIDAATPTATSTLSVRVLAGLKEVATSLATKAKVPVAEYLQKNKPNLSGVNGLEFLPILTTEIKSAYGLAADTTFGKDEFAKLVLDLGVDAIKFSTAFEKAVKDYDGAKTDGTASWAAQIKFWNYALDPAPNNTYANLKKLLKTDNVISDATLANFDKVMTTAKGQPSGIKNSTDSTKDLLGFGGTKAIFTTPATTTPTTGTTTPTTETKPAETTTGSETGSGTPTTETKPAETTTGSEAGSGTPTTETKPAETTTGSETGSGTPTTETKPAETTTGSETGSGTPTTETKPAETTTGSETGSGTPTTETKPAETTTSSETTTTEAAPTGAAA